MRQVLLNRAVRAGRRARRAAAGVRRRIERVDTVPVLAARPRPRPLLRPVHLSVLGGRTLNVAVRYPAGRTASRAHCSIWTTAATGGPRR